MKLPKINIESITILDQARNVIEQLLLLINQQKKEIDLLRAEINRLKGQPKKPLFSPRKSDTSSSVTRFLKEKGFWHKKSKKGTIGIDREEQLSEVKECSCGSTSFTTLRTTRKIVQGVVFQRENVAYLGKIKQCVHCGKRYRSTLPADLKGHTFSSELSSLLSFLIYSCRMTQPLIIRMLQGMGIQISSGQVSNILLKNGEKLKVADHHLRTIGIANSPHLQSDASGAKRKEKATGKIKNQYVQIISHKLLSIFSITSKYTIKTLDRLLTKTGRRKPFVSDDSGVNGNRLSKGRQLCWVHEIRHYQKLFPGFNYHQKLQQRILKQWQEFYHLAKHYGESPPKQQKQKKKQIQQLFDQITSQTTGFDLLDKQLRLTQKKRNRLLLFLDHPKLPIHNNQCEQDLRHFVIIRKISGGTKSIQGDKSLARHLSIIQTAQKQGLDVYKTLHGLLTNTLSPTILTARTC